MDAIAAFIPSYWQTPLLLLVIAVLLVLHAVVGSPEGDEGPEGEDDAKVEENNG